MIMKKITALFALVIVLMLSLGIQQAKSYVGVGDTAPDFTLVSVNGDTISLSDYAGQPVLLNFFHYN
jgi:cytochrome oxidase Cu insertion factor (SCO1/SenC/PrrC family)